MTAERSQQIERLYHDARKRDPSELAAFLEQACGGDYALRREVESLLAQDSNVESFLETPALELAKKMSGEDASQSMIGRQFGPYSVASLVAKGGMGEIYRARDTKLGRDVALKILPATFARDPERLTRFQREARLLASLNHPHIAAIYGMEESGGLHGLVMELVPGETLADRGPLPLVKALTICRQVAEGLEEAHRKNILHRDVKPANVKVTPEGIVKTLDFGLAKAMAWQQSDVDLSELPTVSAVATEEGRILGTPGYMSPEQVRGKAAMARKSFLAAIVPTVISRRWRRSMMRMLCRTLPCCLLCILLLISGPMTTSTHAQSRARVERTSFTISDEFTGTDPCTGVPVVITEVRRVHIIDVFDASGGEHANFVEVVTATAVDAAGNRYVAGQTVMGAGTATVDNGVVVITALTNLHFISTGGGDNLIAHVMERFTITPNGTHGEVTFVSSECVG